MSCRSTLRVTPRRARARGAPRPKRGIRLAIGLGVLAGTCMTCPTARAFGGLWSSENEPIVRTVQEVLWVDQPDSTVTAVVRLGIQGPPQDFAWVIPVPGTVAVATSSTVAFDRLRKATAPQYWVEVETDEPCAPAPGGFGSEFDVGDAGPAGLASSRGAIEPYETLHLPTDPSAGDPVKAATDWLSAQGYRVGDRDGEMLEPYLDQGMNLLVLRFRSNADTNRVRPQKLTYTAAVHAAPFRLTARGTNEDANALVWTVGPAQAVSTNFASLVLNDALIDWLSGLHYRAGTLPFGGSGLFGGYVDPPSNYDAVVAAAVEAVEGSGFVTELGAPASQYRDSVWSPLDDEAFSFLANRQDTDGIDVIVEALNAYAGWDGLDAAVAAATSLPDDVSLDEFALDPEPYRDMVEVDTAVFLRLLEESVVRPVVDTAELLRQGPYLTRLHTRLAASGTSADPNFDFNADLGQVSNLQVAKQTLDCAGTAEASSWRMLLPQGGVISGSGTDDWPVAPGSMPANLKIVELSTRGSGSVVEDNAEAIRTWLSEQGWATGDSSRSGLPRDGERIGGSQSVTPDPDIPQSQPEPARAESSGGGCGVARNRRAPGAPGAGWLVALIALRRRRIPHCMRPGRTSIRRLAWLASALLLACGSERTAPTHVQDAGGEPDAPLGVLSRQALRDPETCKGCHPNHFREWSSSMHAYAAQDPVFLAMNRRGQRETDGELGNFCVRCHAPMAVADGLTDDGLNLEDLPDFERGVSCYFCHNVVAIEGDHNGMLRLADDTTLRGPFDDPIDPVVHGAAYSEIFDGERPESTAMCGGCHDIVNQNGVHLERTFEEYRLGLFSKSATGEPPAFEACVDCHMYPRQGFAAAGAEAPERTVHEHLWPGIDVALQDFPGRRAMRSAVEDCQLGIAIPFFTLEVTPPDLFTFQIQGSAGHHTPSGASQDRRMWLEFLAYDDDGELLADASSGNVADDEVVDRPSGDPGHDPQLVVFRDHIYDTQGQPVHMFWDAAPSVTHPFGYESHVIPVATTTYVEGRQAIVRQFRASGPGGLPARVVARLRMRPIGLDVLRDLVASGDLDPAIATQMPSFTLKSRIEWTPADGVMKTIRATGSSDCDTYRCLLGDDAEECE